MSPWFRAVVMALMIAVPVWMAWLTFLQAAFWFFDYAPPFGDFFDRANASPRNGYGWFGFAVISPVMATWLYAFYRLELLLLGFHRGGAINLATVRHLRGFSLFLLISIILEVFLLGPYLWAMGSFTGENPWFKLQLMRIHVHVGIFSFIFLLISHALVEAVQYKDENEKFF